MKFDDNITVGQKYKPAMEITEQAEADEYFAACVAHAMRVFAKSRQEAECNERINLSRYAYFCDDETRARVERLFHFTAEEAFALGEALASTKH